MILEVNNLKGSKPLIFTEEVVFDDTFKCIPPLLKVNKCEVSVNACDYGEFIEVQIDVKANLTLQSCYTLKPFEYEMDTSEEYQFSDAGEGDDLLPYKGNKIKLDDLIFNLISASIPTCPVAPNETMPKSIGGHPILSEEEYRKEKAKNNDSPFAKLDDIDID